MAINKREGRFTEDCVGCKNKVDYKDGSKKERIIAMVNCKNCTKQSQYELSEVIDIDEINNFDCANYRE